MSSVVDGLRILAHGGTPTVAAAADGRVPMSKQDARARIAGLASQTDVNPETGEPIPPRHDGIPSAVLGTSRY